MAWLTRLFYGNHCPECGGELWRGTVGTSGRYGMPCPSRFHDRNPKP